MQTRITKKDFIASMVNNKTAFIGTTKKRFDADEVYCRIGDCLDKSNILEVRECKARSNDLVFTGGSHLYFESGMTFYMYQYYEGTVYVASTDWVTMYYLVRS